jgi:hypothetical protein
MNIKLLDFGGNEVVVDVGDIETIKEMDITIMSGDEILTVYYKDGTEKEFDSCNYRIWDFYDGLYTLYSEDEGVNLLDDEKFVNRFTSYWYEIETNLA